MLEVRRGGRGLSRPGVWEALVGKSHKIKLELVLPGEEAHSVQMSDYKGSESDTGRKSEDQGDRGLVADSEARKVDKERDGPQSDSLGTFHEDSGTRGDKCLVGLGALR